MTEVNVTRLIADLYPAELSASIAERGANAGPETWANAKAAATETAVLDPADRAAVRDFFKGFGAWDDAEIAAWSPAELDALVLQYAAGDLRELQSLCPGDGLGGIDWAHAERLSSKGRVNGCLYPSGDDLMIYIGD
jgi:hypothetical protein